MEAFHGDMVRALPRLRAVARRLAANDTALAEDLVQDTCVNALAARERFTPGTNMEAWLVTILRNRFFSLIKRHDRTRVTRDDELVARASAGPVPQHGRLELIALTEAFARLRPAEREALVMAATQDCSYCDIAAACHCAVGTVKSRVSRARGRLAHDLERVSA